MLGPSTRYTPGFSTIMAIRLAGSLLRPEPSNSRRVFPFVTDLIGLAGSVPISTIGCIPSSYRSF